MVSSIYLIFRSLYLFFIPDFVKQFKILPVAPLIPYLPAIFKADFLPPLYFTYWIIVLLITATPHEFFHGIFSRIHGVKIKSTGFAFLGPFAGAFVEPDEKKVAKINKRSQISFLAAGSFANLLVTLLFLIITALFFISTFKPSGAMFDNYAVSVVNVSDISNISGGFVFSSYAKLNLTEIKVYGKKYFVTSKVLDSIDEKVKQITVYDDTPALRAGLIGVIIEINGNEIKTYNDFNKTMSVTKPGDKIKIKTSFNESVREYNIILAEHPSDISRGYLGISVTAPAPKRLLGKLISYISFFRQPNTYYAPKFYSGIIIFIYHLLFWIILVNFSVALANMLPLAIFDGGRVFKVTMLGLSGSENFANKAFKISTFVLLFILFLMTVLWVFWTFVV